MLKTIWLIFKKECSRFVKDRRMIFTVILLPALLMYGTYYLMGKFVMNSNTVSADYTYHCDVINAPGIYAPIFDALNFEVANAENVEAAKDGVTQKETDLLVIFPADFENAIQNPSDPVPNIQVYYNYDSATSREAYSLFTAATDELETSIVNILDLNRDVEDPDLSESSSILISMIPMMIVTTLFASCAGLAPESIAGEKERGTFATLLVTPVSRTAIAVGKIISLSLFATLAGLSNFAGMMLGMRQMFAGEADALMPTYSFAEYALLLMVILSAVLMAISIVSIISAFAKSVKEATSSVMIINGVAMVGSMAPMLGIASSGFGWRCIPILGTAISLNDIFMMEYSAVNIAATCISNVAVMLVLVVVLSKMFSSEKIMFNK